ncbi:hypothetical protein BB561_000194 [Smittium simulii]|uniref:Reverse transcriptase domain-containing protein n=1 Tax=Smittium simulii TaxID=133385 RepID=A0A2T9Z069_9FUNG|nr:hypothetical protein BB561_000194 [Smittium simulii]
MLNVPGLSQSVANKQLLLSTKRTRIEHLQIADHAGVLAESSDELQIALDVIKNCTDTHEMSINAGKCGVMPVPGLLFVDNAVIIAESADVLQKSVDTLTECCERWDMNINNKKCGIMAINCSTDTTFKIQNQLIPSVNKYKYL